jgi:hypothetical protein
MIFISKHLHSQCTGISAALILMQQDFYFSRWLFKTAAYFSCYASFVD